MVNTDQSWQTAIPWKALLGYLNFSQGNPDAKFQKQFNAAYATTLENGVAQPWQVLHRLSKFHLTQLQETGGAFANVDQARAVLEIVFEHVLPGYRSFHANLLFHLSEHELYVPLFLVRVFEAVLRQGPPWEDQRRIATATIQLLNDYTGHRPVAILENRRQGEPYEHERFRPIPLYLRGAGAACSKYESLITRCLEILENTSPDLLAEAWFDLKLLDELALDVRSFDHGHPANRRPNYVFGEWDPHQIDNQGRYRRFVVRQVVLDALCDRLAHPGEADAGELAFEAAAVLAGTILMASGISGSGPETHDSSTTLASLMPRIAKYRDGFYNQLLNKISGPHAERLRQAAGLAKQPFAAARQHLNHYLSKHRAGLLQHHHLALLFADMGYAEASRHQASRISTASGRILSEIHIRLAGCELALQTGDLPSVLPLAQEIEDWLSQGIACGALADPWNILGFQGQFPLFRALEDSVRDTRIDELIFAMDQLFSILIRFQGEAGARGDKKMLSQCLSVINRLAGWWDQFASFEVSGLQAVRGGQAAASAEHVGNVMLEWRQRGAGTADLAFWRQHLDRFQSNEAFALVVDALLRKQDLKAAMALLINWLSHSGLMVLDEGEFSFHALAIRWMLIANTLARGSNSAGLSPDDAEIEHFQLKKKFLDYLEANADDCWQPPQLFSQQAVRGAGGAAQDDLFSAAYEGVTFQDSTDRNDGDVLEGGPQKPFDLEELAEDLLRRLRFLDMVARLWHLAAHHDPMSNRPRIDTPDRLAVYEAWLTNAHRNFQEFLRLMDAVFEFPLPDPEGDHDSIVEYDRRRLVKEQLLSAGIATSLDTAAAIGVLESSLGNDRKSKTPVENLPVWLAASHALQLALLCGDAEAAGPTLPELLRSFQQEPLLVQPIDQGGHPRQVLRATLAQYVFRSLLGYLPRAGLLRQTYQVLKLARQMEKNTPNSGRMASVFDHLFQEAVQRTAETIIESASAWGDQGEDGMPLASLLDPVLEKYLTLWAEFGQNLRLSALDGFGDEKQWEEIRRFIRNYGKDLFHARFMTLANLRGILHRGIGPYLDHLIANPDPMHPIKLVDDLNEGINRAQAEKALKTILTAVIENYEEYKDYNTTTTQSDFGDNLHLLLDFLRLKAIYLRQAWLFRPMQLAHDVLARNSRLATLEVWEKAFYQFTGPLADQILLQLRLIEKQHGVKLRTVSDLLKERFVKPLTVARLKTLVEPSLEQSGRGNSSPAFEKLQKDLEPLLANPTGVGLDVPDWLVELEDEVDRVQSSGTALASEVAKVSRIPIRRISLKDFQEQWQQWEQPLD